MIIESHRKGQTSVYYVDDSAPLYPELEVEIKRLRAELAECRQTIEDVCCGTSLVCPSCGGVKPCNCDHK